MIWPTKMFWSKKNKSGPILENQALRLRLPQKQDFAQWSELRRTSKDFLTPFEPSWSLLDLTSKSFFNKVQACARVAKKGEEYSFLIFSCTGTRETVLGGITLSNIRYRAAQQANLGYWLGQPHTGKGHMRKAVALCLGFAFSDLRLNRINAVCLPSNAPSIKVLTNAGFAKEGMAEQFLQINGAFRDHLMFGLTRQRYISFSPN